MLPIVFIAVLLFSLLSGLTTLIGVALALRFKRNVKGIVIGIGFSAGTMLLISYFDLIPNSINSTGTVNEPRWGWVRGR
jgi:ZIP family zinc transporter